MSLKQLTARIARPSELTAAEIAVWDNLSSSQSKVASPFLSYQYAYAVEKAGTNVKVCVLMQDGRSCGFFPFQFANPVLQLFKSATPVGGQMTDYFGLIADQSLHITPEQLLTLAGLNHVSFSHLDESQLAFGLTGERPRSGLKIACRQIEPGNVQTDIFSKKQVKENQRREHHLIEDIGPIRFIFDQQQHRTVHLHHLVEQKRRQYSRTEVPDALADKWKLKLLEQLLYTESATCTGILSQLYAGDQWVASHFGILGNGVLQYWLPVYNPAMAKYAPGKLLLKHIYAAAPLNNIHTIDRGEGITNGKSEIRSEEHRFYRGVWHNHAPSAFIVRSFQSLAWRLNK